jgi:1,2-diacylglycerol 3-alpha-glucosyltransferase
MASVCMLSNLYPPIMSGSALQIFQLSRELARRGHNIVIVTARTDHAAPEHERNAGVEVYRLPAVRLPQMSISLNFPWLTYTFWPTNMRRMKAIIERHNIELLHLHNHMFDLAFSAVWLRHKCGLPLVLSLHTPITHNNSLFNFLLTRAERYLLKPVVVKAADAVVIPDYNVVPYMEQRFGLKAAAVIPYGIHAPAAPAPELLEALRVRYKLLGKRLVLSVGHVHQIRNRLDLIRAFKVVKSRIPDALLLIVGAMAYQPAVDLALELELGDSVAFTGILNHEEVIALLSLADIEAHWFTLEHPALESSPGPATMEAMFAGKTAMTYASENTFGPGVLRNGHNVILVRPGDCDRIAANIVELLQNPARTAAVGEAARQVAEQHFAWPSIAAQFEQVYANCLRLGRTE